MSTIKAVKKPVVVSFQEFDPTRGAEMAFRFKPHFERYLPPTPYQLWNGLHQSWVGLRPGDFVNVSDPNDHYPVDPEVFFDTYDLVEE